MVTCHTLSASPHMTSEIYVIWVIYTKTFKMYQNLLKIKKDIYIFTSKKLKKCRNGPEIWLVYSGRTEDRRREDPLLEADPIKCVAVIESEWIEEEEGGTVALADTCLELSQQSLSEVIYFVLLRILSPRRGN